MRLMILCSLAGAFLAAGDALAMKLAPLSAGQPATVVQGEGGVQKQPQQKPPQQKRSRGGMSEQQLLQNPMVQQILRDPELQQQIMDDPRFEALMQDPQMQRLMQSPQLQRQMQQNQQLQQMYQLQKRPLPGVPADGDD